MDARMTGTLAQAVATVEFLAIVCVAVFIGRKVFRRRGPSRFGAGAVGTVYELLNEDKRKAVELIVEERTGERDPEDRDGSFDDLGVSTQGSPKGDGARTMLDHGSPRARPASRHRDG